MHPYRLSIAWFASFPSCPSEDHYLEHSPNHYTQAIALDQDMVRNLIPRPSKCATYRTMGTNNSHSCSQCLYTYMLLSNASTEGVTIAATCMCNGQNLGQLCSCGLHGSHHQCSFHQRLEYHRSSFQGQMELQFGLKI